MENKNIPILEVKNLKQHFKVGVGKNKMLVKAVDGISFSVNKGEVFSLVGESGCGKTTTGRTLIGLYEATDGDVNFLGKRVVAGLTEQQQQLRDLRKEYTEEIKKTKIIMKNDSSDKLRKTLEEKKEVFLKMQSEIKADIRQRISDNRRPQINWLKKGKYLLTGKGKIKGINEKQEKIVELDILFNKQNKELKQQLKEGKINKEEYNLRLEVYKNERDVKRVPLKQEINEIYEKEIFTKEDVMHRMQMIFQDPIASLNPRMTVKEIIAEGLRIRGEKDEDYINQKVYNALEIVGLVKDHANRYPHEFSGGQRQRIGIARALIVEPDFLIADEPISALDVSIQAQVINLLNDLRVKYGITILFIAHDLSVVKYFSDKIAVMYFGKIVEMGDKDKVFNNPLHPYTLSLLSSIPLPDPSYEKQKNGVNRYHPELEHDYSNEQPWLQEVEKDHFVLANSEEFKKYKEKVK